MVLFASSLTDVHVPYLSLTDIGMPIKFIEKDE